MVAEALAGAIASVLELADVIARVVAYDREIERVNRMLPPGSEILQPAMRDALSAILALLREGLVIDAFASLANGPHGSQSKPEPAETRD